MTNKLKNAFDKISTLSEKEQDAIAEALLAVVDDTWGPEDDKDEAEWDALVGSKRSHAWLDKMVKQVRQDIQEGSQEAIRSGMSTAAWCSSPTSKCRGASLWSRYIRISSAESFRASTIVLRKS